MLFRRKERRKKVLFFFAQGRKNRFRFLCNGLFAKVVILLKTNERFSALTLDAVLCTYSSTSGQHDTDIQPVPTIMKAPMVLS